MRKALLVLLAPIMLAACSSASSAPPVASAHQSPTAKTASAAQYASIVAKYQSDIRKYADTIDSCFRESWGPGEITCPAAPFTMETVIETMLLTLRGANLDRPENKLFIGAPPVEVAALVSSTIDQATESAAALKKASDQCLGTAQTKCLTALLDVQGDNDRLVSELDAWQPYL